MKNQRGKWAGRVFTKEQWLKRDIRSAATRSKKKGVKPTLPKLKCLDEDEMTLTPQHQDSEHG